MTLEGLKCYLKQPKRIYAFFASRGLLNWMSDEAFLKMAFHINMGKSLNLKNPQTFNEKLQWLKLYDRKPEYTRMVDKYEVKQYIAERIGEEHIIPTLGVWDKFEDIDFDSLPDQFVLKCTHDSGGLVICRDKSKLDKNVAKRKINKSLKRNYFYCGSREWPYKNVIPRIIAEQYIENSRTTGKNLDVYKFFCFGGKPAIIQVIQNDKTSEETIDYYDIEWNRLNLRQNHPNSEKPLDRVTQLNKMLKLAAVLSQGHPFLRVDFYEVENKIYFSELTFYSDSGMAKFEPQDWDYKLGEWLLLPCKEKIC